MPSKNKITVSTKLSEEESEVLTEIANAENISISAIIKLCLDSVINGDIRIENGELKIGGDPIGYAVSEDFDELYRYKELRLDRLIDSFERHKYPDHEIRRQIENMLEQIDMNGNYNPRRAGGDWS